jgi:hypothetical protein
MKAVTLIASSSLLLLGVCAADSMAQMNSPPFSVSYEVYPFTKMDSPGSTPAFLQDLEIEVSTLQLDLSYSMMLAEGRHMLVNQLQYRRLDMAYKNWDDVQGGSVRVEQGHSLMYTLMWLHPLSEKWTAMAFVTPGFAGETTDDIGGDSFYFSAAAVFIKKYRETLSVGYGAAYAPSFGEPLPIPIIAIQWNNGANLSVESILPIRTELRYQRSPRLTYGLLLALDGNQYHGSPDRWAPTVNPQLRYSVATFGPTVSFGLPAGFRLNLGGGMTFMRRFEFYDGDDEAGSYDQKPSGFFRVGISRGG